MVIWLRAMLLSLLAASFCVLSPLNLWAASMPQTASLRARSLLMEESVSQWKCLCTILPWLGKSSLHSSTPTVSRCAHFCPSISESPAGVFFCVEDSSTCLLTLILWRSRSFGSCMGVESYSGWSTEYILPQLVLWVPPCSSGWCLSLPKREKGIDGRLLAGRDCAMDAECVARYLAHSKHSINMAEKIGDWKKQW